MDKVKLLSNEFQFIADLTKNILTASCKESNFVVNLSNHFHLIYSNKSEPENRDLHQVKS